MKKKVDLLEVLIIVGCLLFMVAISLYHLSFNGYLGLSATFWDMEWSVAENGLFLFLTWIISILTFEVVRNVFRYILMPYFFLKLVYQFSCYSGIYLFSKQTWESIWSVILVCLILLGITYVIIMRR